METITGRRWTNEEDELLLDLINKNYCISDMIIFFDRRTKNSISKRLKKLGIKNNKYWSEDEIKLLEKCYKEKVPYDEMEILLKRSKVSILNKAMSEGISKKYPYKRLLPPNHVIYDLYVNQHKNCKEICRMFNVNEKSSGNVGIILKSMGVNIRQDKGQNHHNWKGGKTCKGDGYIGIWKPEHERADNQGYVYEHTLVYEEFYGVLPQKGEVIHHIDLDKHNNNIDNLYLCNYKDHMFIHRSVDKLIKPLLDKGIIVFDNGQYRIADESLDD